MKKYNDGFPYDNFESLTIDELYDKIINILNYQNSSNFKIDDTKLYDSCYSLMIDKIEYPVVGIKKFDTCDEESIKKLHLKYWNRNDLPISILIIPGEIRIYNNYTIDKKNGLLYSSKMDNCNLEILEMLHDSKIITKAVWNKLSSFSNKKDRVDNKLLNSLKETISYAYKMYGMKFENAYNFMAQCIFIKYLEDRGILTEGAFVEYNVNCFSELLKCGCIKKLYSFFCFLKERFNGDLFDVDIAELPNEKQLEIFSRFFNGELIASDGNSQLTMFPYDFSVIPIELISNIYETFFNLNDKFENRNSASDTGAFYTPYYVADFMILQCFEYNTSNMIKVMDPSCGSGVFLVGAYKRLILNYKAEFENIDTQMLKEILTKQIYGIDINQKSLKITCFSLYLALLEELTPKDILKNNFKLPNLLGNNLYCKSFFDNKLDELKLEFDIIIGNPPWKSDKTQDHIAYCKKENIPISDSQLAQAFVARAKDFAKEDTIISLIVTNSIFTNLKACDYRNYIFNNFKIVEVINFNSIRKNLFAHAGSPCSVLTYKIKTNKDDYILKYYSFKENMIFKLLNKFVYDKEEIINIRESVIKEESYLWYVLTIGDEFDANIIRKMRKHGSLNNLLMEKDIGFHQGYAAKAKGKNQPARPEFLNYKGGSLKGCFEKYAVNYENIPKITETVYNRGRALEIYTCPNKVLLKRTYNKSWGASFCEKPIIFSNDFYAINDYSGKNLDFLRYLEGIFNSKLFYYYCCLMTKFKVTLKTEIEKANVENFPIHWLGSENLLVRKVVERVIKMENKTTQKQKNAVESFTSYNDTELLTIQDEIDKIIYDIYELDNMEIEIVENAIYQFGNRQKDTVKYASERDYDSYSKYICDYFDGFLNEAGYEVQIGQLSEYNFYASIIFNIVKKHENYEKKKGVDEDISQLTDLLGMASWQEVNNALLIKNKVVGFFENGFYLVKTKEKINWTLLKAKKDAMSLTKHIFQSQEGENMYD